VSCYPLGMRLSILLSLLCALAIPAAAQEPKPKPIKIGKPAPDFKLKNQLGKQVQLAAFKKKTKKRGARWVLMAFYPKAGTPG